MRDGRHLAWIRTLPSAVSGREGCVAAHISFADQRFGKPKRGKGTKADDRWCLPLTPYEHTDGPNAQHRTGDEEEWWLQHGIDANTLANDLWSVSGDTDAAIAILNQARTAAARRKLWPAGRNREGD